MHMDHGNPNARITRIAAQNDAKYPLQLFRAQTTIEMVDHYKNSIPIIPTIINILTSEGITHEIDFALFQCSYIQGIKTYVMTMPTCYANIIQRKVHIIARLENTIYKLEPKPDPYVAREKNIDTGVNWATCVAQAGTIDKLDAIETAIKTIFAKQRMRVVGEVKPLFEKELGAGSNKYRAAFEILEGWDKLTVHKIRDSKLPSNAGITIKFSNEFHELHGLHARCSKTTDNRAAVAFRCSCDASGAGPSSSMANRQAAHMAHRARALKRARDDAAQGDPFE